MFKIIWISARNADLKSDEKMLNPWIFMAVNLSVSVKEYKSRQIKLYLIWAISLQSGGDPY